MSINRQSLEHGSDSLVGRKRAARRLGIELARSLLPYYYEHLLVGNQRGHWSAEAAAIYFRHYYEPYAVLGHRMFNVNGTAVLVFWTGTDLDMTNQRDMDYIWEPMRSTYNFRNAQPLVAFQAWYETQDEEARLSYWQAKLFLLAERKERSSAVIPEPQDVIQATRSGFLVRPRRVNWQRLTLPALRDWGNRETLLEVK